MLGAVKNLNAAVVFPFFHSFFLSLQINYITHKASLRGLCALAAAKGMLLLMWTTRYD